MREKGISKSIMAAAIVVIVAVAGVGAYFLTRGEGEGPGPDPEGGPDGEDSEVEGIINPDDLTQITFFEGEGVNSAFDPDWSPDGTQIVFEKEVGDNEQGLYIINSDGTGLFKIGSPGYDHIYDPSWSPVDNRILCGGWREGENSALYMIDLDNDKTKIVSLGVQYAMFPAWSPDGKKIVFYVYDDSNAPLPLFDNQCEGTGILSSVWIMNSDGTGKTQLTTDEDGYCSDPSFSPDGSKIVYNKGYINPGIPTLTKEPANEIWVMDNDGSNKHAIYAPGDSKFFLHQRAWSKNNEILFERFQWKGAGFEDTHGSFQPPEIWVMNADGTNPRCMLRPERPDATGNATMYGDTAWDTTGTKVVTTQWNISEERPHIYVDRNVITFYWEE